MSRPDLNLLHTLDVLLSEGSVARAGRKLQLSSSAMSRALARLREATGDPLLVRAGRGLVPTPRAMELRDPVHRLLQEVLGVLRPSAHPNLKQIVRTFTLRTSEGFAENFGPALIALVAKEAPGVRLCFVLKPDKDSAPLREGVIDFETGVVAKSMGPEVRALGLFRDRFVGVVRAGHPLSRGRITPARYAACGHVAISRPGLEMGPVDEALSPLGLERKIAATVAGFATAIAVVRASDLVATVPERHTGILREGMHSFRLPVATPEFTVSLLWHPRMDADPAHRWMRDCIRIVCSKRITAS